MKDRSGPTAEVCQGEQRGAGMRPEAAGHVFRVIISATDPNPPVENSQMTRIDLNGTAIISILFVLYLAGALALMSMSAPDPANFDVERIDRFFWTSLWAAQGSIVWLAVLGFLNRLFKPPAHSLYLLFLFFISLGGLYLYFNWKMGTGIFGAA
jgi:hypothetical protein